MPVTFYHVDWCPECVAVKEKLDALKIPYDEVIVPDVRMFRKQVHAVSGQYYVPVIKDGDLVLTETADILSYLEDHYGPAAAQGSGTSKPQSQALSSGEAPGEDDAHPSCRIR